MRARELLDEVPDLYRAAVRLGDLLIQPETPGKIATGRLSMERLDVFCMILHVGFCSSKTFANELLRLAPEGACDLIEPYLGMVLNTPEHTFPMPNLCCLHVGERICREKHCALGELLHLVRV